MIESERDRGIGDGRLGHGRIQGAQRNPRSVRRSSRGGRQLAGMRLDGVLELAGRVYGIDDPPCGCPLALHAFDQRGEEIRPIAADVALVHQTRQAAGSGKHGKERRLRQAHRRMAIIDQQDLVARQCQLVPAAGAGAVQRREKPDTGLRAGVLHREARFVGVLAEVHLPAVARAAQHHDVRAGAEYPLLQAGDDDHADIGVLEAQALNGVRQLDVDPEIVGIELEPIIGATAPRLRARPSPGWRWRRRRPVSSVDSARAAFQRRPERRRQDRRARSCSVEIEHPFNLTLEA